MPTNDFSDLQRYSPNPDVEIEAETLGHDLFWGTAVFTRLVALGADSSTIQSESDTEPAPAGAVAVV
jgi:hypothetical protein